MTRSDLPDDQDLISFITQADTTPKLRDIARFFGLPPAMRPALRRKLLDLADSGQLESSDGADFGQENLISGVKLAEITSIDHDGYLSARLLSEDDSHMPPIQVVPPRAAGHYKKHDKQRSHQPKIGDHVLIRVRMTKDEVIIGDIMRILPKTNNRLYGRIFQKRGKWMLETAEKGANRPLPVMVPDDIEISENLLIEAELLPRRGRSETSAKLKRIIGPMSSPQALAQLAITEFELPHIFPETLLKQAEIAQVPEVGRRTDIQELPLVTIDGEDAKDFDDAVFAEPSDTGGWRLIVAIADVSAYVAAGSDMDVEAQRRGNSVYLPGTVIPMLPEALSNGVCSLRPNEPRACLAVEIFIDSQGQKQSHKFFRGLMKSSARLTYNAVQSVMDGLAEETDIHAPNGTIHHLAGAFHCLKSARDKRGTLNLNIQERRVEIDETGMVSDIVLRSQKPAHQLIEEFMILANVCAAETLETASAICVYRNHDRPDPEKLEALHEITTTLSLPFAKGQVIQPHLFNKLIAATQDKPEAQMINETILRCQARAHYEIENIGHYGLSLIRYAHFTSPIRRYSDLLVHRSIIAASKLGNERLGTEDPNLLKQVCAHISMTEVTAARAERRTTDRLAALYFLGAEGQVFDVRITGVNKAGLFVQMQDGLAEGFIPRKSLPDDRYDIVTGGMVLQGHYTGWKFALGDDLQAKLLEITPASGGLLFSWQGGGTQVFDAKERRFSKGKQHGFKHKAAKSRGKSRSKHKKR